MYELSIKEKISSAHFLLDYEGKCKNLHGHTWVVEAFILGADLTPQGMVVDFTVLKKDFKEFLAQFDHNCLNEIEYFKNVNPTSENIAKYIYQEYSKIVAPLKLSKVCVWESDTSSVCYYE